mgnify:CR=1 FL=1
MKIEGEYVFDAPRQAVWNLAHDPEVIRTTLSGIQLTHIGERECAGELCVQIGPVAGILSGRLVVSEETPPEICILTLDSEGPIGHARGSGQVQLLDADDNKTLMTYTGELRFGGQLAKAGQRALNSIIKTQIQQILEAFNTTLQTRQAPTGTYQVAEPEPPPKAGQVPETNSERSGQLLMRPGGSILLLIVPLVSIALGIVMLFSRRKKE